MVIVKKPVHKSESQLDSHLIDFIEMRFELSSHSFFYFKALDVFEYNTIPNKKCPVQYMKPDVSNLGRYITICCNSGGNYKDIYRITTYIHRKRGSDVYKCEKVINK